MTLLKIGELFHYVIGGGWGEDSAAPGLTPVTIIRGADFPHAQVQDTRGFPRRFEDPTAVTRRSLTAGDLVLEISGGTKERPTGRTVYVTKRMLESTDGDLIPASFCRLVRPDQERVDPRWLYYFMQNWWNRGESWNFQNQSTGISNFRFKVFSEEVTLQLPGRAQQEAASAALGALDDKIAANRRLVAAAEQLGKTLASSVPSTPTPLSDLAAITMGTSPRGDQLNELGVGMPFFQGVRDFKSLFPATRVFTDSPVRTARGGDVLFAVRAPVGKVNLAMETTAIGRGLAALSAHEAPATLYFCLNAHESVWDQYEGAGTIFTSVSRNEVRSTEIPWPISAEAVEVRLHPLLDRAVAAEQESAKLAATRDELLPLLMSGRITVKDAEKTVEDVI